ncbi:metal-dependent hydrolase [Bacterioplanoides sp.]|uniref:metal-dependent hydrolase n=1 Tax=Bacterioplanoides sp. TaxID=2066072 RepID=UPI003B5A7EBB
MTDFAINNNKSVTDSGSENVAVEIKPRRMNFPFQQVKARKFFNNNTLLSAFGAVLSGTFPPGEAEFIASVRLYRDRIDNPELKQQISGFIGQEGHHSHQHGRANKVLQQLGWDAPWVEQRLAADIRKRNKNKRLGSDKFRLALTAGLEHLTAIMSEYMLTHPQVLDDLDPTVRELIFWHAVEEIEHKAVAFDLFMLCENDQKYMQRVLRLGTVMFITKILRLMVRLMWKAKTIPSWREAKQFWQFMFAENGLITQVKTPYKDYFREGFHPWDHNNQELIDMWKKQYYRADHDKGSEQYRSDTV